MNRFPLAWTDSTDEVEAREFGQEVCQALTARLAETMPPELAEWAPAWDVVRDASARFIGEVVAWELSPTDTAQHRVRSAYIDLRVAWGEAEFLYDRERRAVP